MSTHSDIMGGMSQNQPSTCPLGHKWTGMNKYARKQKWKSYQSAWKNRVHNVDGFRYTTNIIDQTAMRHTGRIH